MYAEHRTGYSLLEVLVVLGIVVLLVSILLPTIALVRGRSDLTACASQLHQITAAAIARSQSTKGFLPLAGVIRLPADTEGYGSLPARLADSAKLRYAYIKEDGPAYFTPTKEQIAPFPMALVADLGMRRLDPDERTIRDWQNIVKENKLLAVFRCPALGDDAPSRPFTALEIGNVEYVTLNDVRMDYALNEGVVGYSFDDTGDRRLAGAVIRIRQPSSVVLMGDANPMRPTSQTFCWTPTLSTRVAVSLADVLQSAPNVSASAGFDVARHRGSANIAFVDGHVETVRLDAASLSGALLLPPTR